MPRGALRLCSLHTAGLGKSAGRAGSCAAHGTVLSWQGEEDAPGLAGLCVCISPHCFPFVVKCHSDHPLPFRTAPSPCSAFFYTSRITACWHLCKPLALPRGWQQMCIDGLSAVTIKLRTALEVHSAPPGLFLASSDGTPPSLWWAMPLLL